VVEAVEQGVVEALGEPLDDADGAPTLPVPVAEVRGVGEALCAREAVAQEVEL
jgi:hypothetical protein